MCMCIYISARLFGSGRRRLLQLLHRRLMTPGSGSSFSSASPASDHRPVVFAQLKMMGAVDGLMEKADEISSVGRLILSAEW